MSSANPPTSLVLRTIGTVMRLHVAVICLVLAASGCTPGGNTAGACSGTDVQLLSETHMVIATDASYPPFAFLEPGTAESTGFDIELLRDLADRMNLEVRFVRRAHSALIPGLVARRFDVVASGLRASPDLADQVCTTEPHLPGDLALAVRTGSEISDVGDLEGLSVGVERGTPGAAWARDRLTGSQLVSFPVTEDPFHALAAGEVEAVLHDAPIAAHHQREIAEVLVVDQIALDAGYVFAVHPENRGLRDALDAALALLREDGTYDRIYERWFGRTE